MQLFGLPPCPGKLARVEADSLRRALPSDPAQKHVGAPIAAQGSRKAVGEAANALRSAARSTLAERKQLARLEEQSQLPSPPRRTSAALLLPPPPNYQALGTLVGGGLSVSPGAGGQGGGGVGEVGESGRGPLRNPICISNIASFWPRN